MSKHQIETLATTLGNLRDVLRDPPRTPEGWGKIARTLQECAALARKYAGTLATAQQTENFQAGDKVTVTHEVWGHIPGTVLTLKGAQVRVQSTEGPAFWTSVSCLEKRG